MEAPHLTNPWIRVAVFNRKDPAEALGKHLHQKGLEIRTHDEQNMQRFWFLTRPRAGFSVEVPEESLPQTQQILDSDPESPELLREAFRCPSCGSLRIEYPQMTRKNLLPTLLAHGLMAMQLMNPQCYCETCHYTWDPDRKVTGMGMDSTPHS